MSPEFAFCPLVSLGAALLACHRRGYCGPFRNEHVYDSHAEPEWRGYGECVECGSTVFRATHLARHRNLQALRVAS